MHKSEAVMFGGSFDTGKEVRLREVCARVVCSRVSGLAHHECCVDLVGKRGACTIAGLSYVWMLFLLLTKEPNPAKWVDKAEKSAQA